MQNVTEKGDRMRVRRAGAWAVLILSVICGRSGAAEERPAAEPDYSNVLAACGRKGSEQVSFFSAFGGLWPVPTNLVLVDAANNRVEYSDLAFPWREVRKPSRVFFGGRASLEKRWSDLFSRKDGATTQKCSLQVTRYAHWDNFNAPVVIVSDDRDHLLLVGPISGAVDAAIECYASTARLRGRICD